VSRKENHNIEIQLVPFFLLEEHNTTTDEILLDLRGSRLIKNNAKVEIKFYKNTANGNPRKAVAIITVLLTNKKIE
jgi:hypothetical protein